MEVINAPKAKKSINIIATYIIKKGYPETAEKFIDKLYDFGDSLVILPESYPICHQKILSRHNMRCAVFYKNYLFVYKVVNDDLNIYNVIHLKTNPANYKV